MSDHNLRAAYTGSSAQQRCQCSSRICAGTDVGHGSLKQLVIECFTLGLARGITLRYWGTGMIASSSTFCPHPGRVIRDLFRQFHAVWHGTGALVHSNHPREAAASSYLAIIFRRIASGVPWFLRSTAVLMQLSHQCWP